MPDAAQIKKAADRRAARDEKRSSNKEAAAAELLATAKLTETQNKARAGDADAKATLVAAADARPKKANVSRAQKKIIDRAAAEKQADADVRVEPQVDEDKLQLSYWRDRGQEPPLYVLNHHAQQADAGLRDDARELARAVGQEAYNQALDRGQRGRHSRERKANKMIDELRRAQAAAETK